MSQAVLRAATPEDRAALLDLWVEAWSAAMPAIDFDARRPWFSARWDELERDGALTVIACAAGHDGAATEIAGFVTLSLAAHDLDQLVVKPARQGQGLAKRLIDEAKRLSPDGLGLHVNQDNAGALRLYRREGFAIVGEGVNPRSGLPVWRMEWQPDPAQPRSLSG